MSAEIPMISLIKKGTKQYPRYSLAKADEYRNPVYWNGQLWTSDESDAILFIDITQALWTHHDLMMESVGDLPRHLYVAPLYIEIFGERPKLADLREWLEKSVRIVVSSPNHGHGPTNGSLAVLYL
jgi:hypothetical protein